jgi:hypothetical protein
VLLSSVTVPKVRNLKVARRRPCDGTDSEEDRKMKKRPPPKNSITTTEPMETTGPSGNRFAALSDHEDTDIQEEDAIGDEEEEANPTEESDEKPPPIVLHGKYEHKKLLDLSAQSTEKGVSLKFTRENTIIYAKTIKDFNALKENLKKSSKAEWHTYATKKEKTHGFVAYGLDNNPTPEDIKRDLEDKGINCKNAYRMKNTNTPLYVIITDNKTTLRDLETNARTIEYVVVRWKKLINRRAIVQCHNCQTWGHAASNCFAATRCLKCAKNHRTSECTLKRESEDDQKMIRCSNCGRGHLANSEQCEVYVARKNFLEKTKSTITEKIPKQSYVPAPIPVKNPWTTNRNTNEPSRNPAAAHMNATRARLAEEVAAQSTATTAAINKESMNDFNVFVQILDELKKLKEKVDFGKILRNLKKLNEKTTKESTTSEIIINLMSLDLPALTE